MITFELHLTTNFLDLNGISRFEKFCEVIQAKPIVIQLPKGQFQQQPMISKVIQVPTEKVLIEKVEFLQKQFIHNRFEIKRTKIEIPIWEKPKTISFFKNQSCQYYEWHGKIKIENEELIQNIINKYDGRLSRNSLKKDIHSKFITLRDYSNSEINIVNNINKLKAELLKNELILSKEELEFCIFDSNEKLDKGWIL